MTNQNHIRDAIEIVLGREEEGVDFGCAVIAQAEALAGRPRMSS